MLQAEMEKNYVTSTTSYFWENFLLYSFKFSVAFKEINQSSN